jgi:hypothetical protein
MAQLGRGSLRLLKEPVMVMKGGFERISDKMAGSMMPNTLV